MPAFWSKTIELFSISGGALAIQKQLAAQFVSQLGLNTIYWHKMCRVIEIHTNAILEILIGPDDRENEVFYGCIRNVTFGPSKILSSWCRLVIECQ
jgi:hypothetical protein